jgi:mRNA interferase MazF
MYRFGRYIDQIKSRKTETDDMPVKRGEIYYADLSPVVGSEQGGIRPVLIVQNDVGNKHSPTVIAAAITSQKDKTHLPTHIEVQADKSGLAKDSIVLLEQIRTIDKKRLKDKMGELDLRSMNKVNTALSISFGLEL